MQDAGFHVVIYDDLATWQRWHARRQGIAKRGWRSLKSPPPQFPSLFLNGNNPSVLVALDWYAPSSAHALIAPLRSLVERRVQIAVLAFAGFDSTTLPGTGWVREPTLGSEVMSGPLKRVR